MMRTAFRPQILLILFPAVLLGLSFYGPVISLFIPGAGSWPSAFAYLNDPLFWHSITVTIRISALTAIISVLFALPLSIYVSLSSPFVERLCLALVFSSLFSSILLRTFSWYVVLARNGPLADFLRAFTGDNPTLLFTEFALVLGMSHILIPTATIALWSRFRLDAHAEYRLAKTLGAGGPFHIARVMLAKNSKSVGLTFILIYLLSAGFVITPILLGGGGGDTMMLGVLIEEQINRFGDWSSGSALAILLTTSMVISILPLLVIGHYWSKKRGREN